MISSRIFVCTATTNISQQEADLIKQLIADLQRANAEIITDNGIANDQLIAFLRRELPQCKWLVFVQTAEALRSFRLQTILNEAVHLVNQHVLHGTVRIICPSSGTVHEPPHWSEIPSIQFNGDYPRIRDKLLLELGLFQMSSEIRRSDMPSVPLFPSFTAIDDKTSANSGDKPGSLAAGHIARGDRPIAPPVTQKNLLFRWYTIAALVVVIATIAGLTPLLYWQVIANGKSKATGQPTQGIRPVTPTPLATAIPKPTTTSTSQTQSGSTPTNMPSTSTPTSTPSTSLDPYTGRGTLVLNDPLQDNSQNVDWMTGPNSNNASCAFVDGAYQTSQPVDGDFHACFALNSDYSNFVFEVQMTIISGYGGGVIFRGSQANSTFYYFRVSPDGSYDLRVYVDPSINDSSLLTSGNSSAIQTGYNQPNIIAVVANNSTLTLYVNHQQITSVINSTFSHGQIGVVAFNMGGQATVVYNNAKVWAL